MGRPVEEKKAGAPAWMVSFGDMMTLILTFFILLVSMSKEQHQGLMARGVGSFLIALRSFGLPGVLDDAEKAAIFDNVRWRFNLPPEDVPERREVDVDASNLELIRATAAKALKPHDEVGQPSIAVFAPGSTELDENARRYLNAVAPTLRPGGVQVLLLEGHAQPTTPNARWIAFQRARVVRDYLIEEHGFDASRMEARAWIAEIEPDSTAARSVDARLVIPSQTQND